MIEHFDHKVSAVEFYTNVFDYYRKQVERTDALDPKDAKFIEDMQHWMRKHKVFDDIQDFKHEATLSTFLFEGGYSNAAFNAVEHLFKIDNRKPALPKFSTKLYAPIPIRRGPNRKTAIHKRVATASNTSSMSPDTIARLVRIPTSPFPPPLPPSSAPPANPPPSPPCTSVSFSPIPFRIEDSEGGEGGEDGEDGEGEHLISLHFAIPEAGRPASTEAMSTPPPHPPPVNESFGTPEEAAAARIVENARL